MKRYDELRPGDELLQVYDGRLHRVRSVLTWYGGQVTSVELDSGLRFRAPSDALALTADDASDLTWRCPRCGHVDHPWRLEVHPARGVPTLVSPKSAPNSTTWRQPGRES